MSLSPHVEAYWNMQTMERLVKHTLFDSRLPKCGTVKPVF